MNSCDLEGADEHSDHVEEVSPRIFLNVMIREMQAAYALTANTV